MRFSDVVSNRLYVSVNSIDQQIPSALTREQALTTPRLATPGTIAGDHGRDIDSIRIQNRTRFDWRAVKLDVGAFVNAKSLYHPIFELVDQEGLDRGGYFRLDYAGDFVEATFGGEHLGRASGRERGGQSV